MITASSGRLNARRRNNGVSRPDQRNEGAPMNENIEQHSASSKPILTPREINQSIIAEICHIYGVDIRDVMSRKRDAPISRARQRCYVELHKRGVRCSGKMSLLYVARFFSRDHTTILHGIRRSKELGL